MIVDYFIENGKCTNSEKHNISKKSCSSKRILFGGYIGYDSHFSQFRTFNYAILGISTYQPSWFISPMHTPPPEAVTAFKEFNIKKYKH